MPQSRGGGWEYAEGEQQRSEKDAEVLAENKGGHRSINEYKLPSWVQHPDFETGRKFVIEKSAFVGAAVNGSRNYEGWNVAHVAAFHDDLKLLSLATDEQLVEPNRWGMVPLHMCSMGVHSYGAALCVMYELIQRGAADPTVKNFQGWTPWHLAQRQHTPENLKAFEKVLYKGQKPDAYDEKKEAQLRPRGKFRPKLSGDGPAKSLPVCLLFPGQGSQNIGMMKKVKDLEPVRAMLEQSTKILGYDILKICLESDEETLAQTKYCQPAMYIAGLAALEQLKIDSPEKVERCQAVAGLSLGEYTALTAAGVFDFETGLRLVKARAEAMEYETTKPGAPKQSMLSVAGLEKNVVDGLCAAVVEKDEVCSIANCLFPKGFSVAGNTGAIERLEKKVTEAGALQAKILKTSGAFHTPMMLGARSVLLAKLEELEGQMQPPKCKVYMNITSKPIGPDASVKDIIKMLGDQLVSPVLWDASMSNAIDDGCKEFFECGPNKQLKSMMKRINKQISEATTNVQV